jgi:multiple sugar transport system permease protein
MKGSASVSAPVARRKPRAGFLGQTAQTRIGHALLHLALMMVGVAFVAPLVWMLSTSLKADSQVFTWPPLLFPLPFQWHNYKDAMTVMPFPLFFRNSFIIAAAVILGTLGSNTLVAYGFARVEWPGRNAVFVLVLSTMVLPVQVRMIPLYLIFKRLGWIGTWLPLTVPAFFGSAYYLFLIRQFMMALPVELSDAARIDGCGEVQILTRILLPLLRPVLAVVMLFTFIGSWSDFLGPLIYLRDVNTYTVTLGLRMFQAPNRFAPMNQIMAASTLVMIPVLVIFFAAQRVFVQGIAITGLSGR